MRTILFFRNYRRFSGGNLKTWHYFNHVLASPTFNPRVWFSAKSTREHHNPWRDAQDLVVDPRNPIRPDVIFVGGRNWKMWDQYPYFDLTTPVINLVQHVRHGDSADKRFEYLSRNAVRICVSDEVAQAVRDTGLAQGPLLTIPLGLDLENLPAANGERQNTDVLIAGLKQPELGAQLERRLQQPGRRVELITDQIPRPDFLNRIRQARTTVFLPHQTEGCHMPPMEGMALGTLVVCPDILGVSYCLAGYNAFRPAYTVDELSTAAETALALTPERAAQLRANARRTAEENSLLRERQAFLDVLDNLDDFWGSTNAVQGPKENANDRTLRPKRTRRQARPAILAD